MSIEYKRQAIADHPFGSDVLEGEHMKDSEKKTG
jgi:hypothetical protein